MEDKIYVYLNTKSSKSEIEKVQSKINFIKTNYAVSQTIMIYETI